MTAIRTIPTPALRARRDEHAAAIRQILAAEHAISTTCVSAENLPVILDLVVRKRNCEAELLRRGVSPAAPAATPAPG